MKRALALAAAVLVLAVPGRARAATVLQGYATIAQASGVQWTYDFPSAPFHPLAESDSAYSNAALDQSRGSALASAFWPGSAGGNFGSLVGVLGGPTVNQLNDPVRASASSGVGAPHQSLGSAPGPVMDASVEPSSPGDQSARARAATGNQALGSSATAGATTTESDVNLDPAAGTLTATASSVAHDIVIGGVVTIQSVQSTAKATSAGGAKPGTSGSTLFTGVKIGGAPVTVDGKGIHVNQSTLPGAAESVSQVDTALANAGMSIYFTKPVTVVIGEVSYYYAASMLVYWQPPHDTNGDSFTVSLGGAAVAMSVTSDGLDSTPPAPAGGVDAGAPPASGSPVVTQGTPVIPPAPVTPTLQLPSQPSAAPSLTAGPRTSAARPLLAASSHGLGVGWLLGALLVGLAAAALFPRVPALVAAAADPVCPREQVPGD